MQIIIWYLDTRYIAPTWFAAEGYGILFRVDEHLLLVFSFVNLLYIYMTDLTPPIAMSKCIYDKPL